MSVYPSSFEKCPINIPIEQEFTYSEYKSKAGDSESCGQNQNAKGLATAAVSAFSVRIHRFILIPEFFFDKISPQLVGNLTKILPEPLPNVGRG